MYFKDFETISKLIEGFSFEKNKLIKCDSEKKVAIIPDGVDEIASKTFSSYSLKEIFFSDTVKKIAIDAFDYCPNVEITHWPESFPMEYKIEVLKNLAINNRFAEKELMDIADSYSDATISFNIYKFLCDHGCKRLYMKVGDLYSEGKGTEQDYEKAIFYYNKVSDNKKIEAQQKILVLKELISSEEIKKGSYNNDDSIVDFEIPEGVRIIKQRSFNNCENLVSIRFPSSLREICRKSFNYCSAITEIEFPKGLSIIGDNCFKDCINLKRIVFNSIPQIGPDCFCNCNNLDENSREILSGILIHSNENENINKESLIKRLKESAMELDFDSIMELKNNGYCDWVESNELLEKLIDQNKKEFDEGLKRAEGILIKLGENEYCQCKKSEVLKKLENNILSDEEYLWLYRMDYFEEVGRKYPLYLPMEYNSSSISTFINSQGWEKLNTTEIVKFIEKYFDGKIQSIKNELFSMFSSISDTFTFIKTDLCLEHFLALARVANTDDFISSRKFKTLVKQEMQNSEITKDDLEDIMSKIHQFVDINLNLKSMQKTVLYKFYDEGNESEFALYDVFEFASTCERYKNSGKQVCFSVEVIDRVSNKKVLADSFYGSD